MSENSDYNPSNLSLDEIVFKNRNKEYGAYDLRTMYPRLLTKSFIAGTAFFILAIVAPFVYLKIQQMNKADQTEVKADLIDILPDEPVLEQPKEEEPVNTNEIYESVDQAAEYPGGMGALRSFLSSNFDTSLFDGGEGKLTAKLKFVVERDGSVSDVRITTKSGNTDFDNESVRAVKKLKKWKPGKVNGENVRSNYSIPFTMDFQ